MDIPARIGLSRRFGAIFLPNEPRPRQLQVLAVRGSSRQVPYLPGWQMVMDNIPAVILFLLPMAVFSPHKMGVFQLQLLSLCQPFSQGTLFTCLKIKEHHISDCSGRAHFACG
jgi:hypothetical protein